MQYGETALRYLLQPVRHLLDDPAITEIVVNRPGEVGFERDGAWTWLDMPEFDFGTLDAIGLLAGRMTNRDCDPAHPMCNSTLPDGQRIHICRPPVTAVDLVSMCIRKPPATARRMEDPDFRELFALANTGRSRRSADNTDLISLYHARDWLPLFTRAVQVRKSIGVVGITGSGKTDLLRRLLGAVPEDNRLVAVESDWEFGDVGPRNRVNLLYDDEAEGRRAVDVVKTALRMYPKTIAFQEVRGPESFALIRAILSGHNSFTSWHADQDEEVTALCMMLRQHPSCQSVPMDQLAALVRQCFDMIVYCERSKELGFKVVKVWFKAAEEELAA